MIIRCHRNLHRHDWSLTVKGRVYAHVSEIILRDVRFIVRESARLRVIERQCREVHAWAEGEIAASWPIDARRVSISYNPYVSKYFFELATGNAVLSCPWVHFTAHEGAIGMWPQ
jgi:hypothetical protein